MAPLLFTVFASTMALDSAVVLSSPIWWWQCSSGASQLQLFSMGHP